MFGNNLMESLIIQNAAQNTSQERFDFELASGDSEKEIADRLDIYLNNGYIIYDLLNDEAKSWIDIVLG